MVMRDHHGRSSVRPVKQDIVSSLFQIPWAVTCQPCFPANCKSVGINVRWCWQDEEVFFCSPHSMNLGLLFEDGTSSHFKNEAEQTLLTTTAGVMLTSTATQPSIQTWWVPAGSTRGFRNNDINRERFVKVSWIHHMYTALQLIPLLHVPYKRGISKQVFWLCKNHGHGAWMQKINHLANTTYLIICAKFMYILNKIKYNKTAFSLVPERKTWFMRVNLMLENRKFSVEPIWSQFLAFRGPDLVPQWDNCLNVTIIHTWRSRWCK